MGLGDRFGQSLVNRFRVPEPRTALGQGLIGLARASLDVSDGLVADLGHIAEVSGLGIELRSADVPLSPAGAAAVEAGKASIGDLLTAGDDYEIAFTAAAHRRARLRALAAKTKVALTCVGRAVAGRAVKVLDGEGRAMPLARSGYRHF